MKQSLFDIIIAIIFVGTGFFGISMWYSHDKLVNRIQQQNKYIRQLQQEANDAQVDIDSLQYQLDACELLYRGV